MEFEWDEDKRAVNLAKHDIDFNRARTIWDSDVLDPYARNLDRGELRIIAIGAIHDDRGEKSSQSCIRDGKVACVSSARGQRGTMSERLTRVSSDDPVVGDRTHWARFHAMTDEQNEANIASDFDSWPLDDQSRGYFFHIHPDGKDRWTWDMVDRDSRIVARAPADYDDWDAAEASTLPLKDSLKAA